jgi:DNA-binding SARP family transcriptional activator/TolB-like protein
MIQLTVLGDVELRADDGHPIGSVLSQPRRLALLVYVALEGNGGGVQRDHLLGIFWPDLPQDQARQSLRTALHFLRRSLGPDAIDGDGGAVRLDPSVIGCDAAAFLAALRDDGERALQLYRGDLLPGFYLDGGPVEFERWLDETRLTLRRKAAETAWALASAQEMAGNPAGAGAWARNATRLMDGDEASVRRCIELLGRIGDRAGALTAYQSLASRLRDEFDATPSRETEAAISRVRDGEPTGAGPAAGGPVAASPSAWTGEGSGSAPAQTAVAEPTGAVVRGWRARARRASRSVYSTVVTLVLVAGFYSLWGLSRGGPVPAIAGSESATIVHVEDIRDFSTDGATTDLAGALTMEITARLSEIQSLQVMAAGRVTTPRDEPPAYILRGGLMRSDSTVRLTAMLLDGVSGATLDRISAERTEGTAAATSAELAEVMTRRVRREIGRVVEDRERVMTARSPRALALVRGALHDIEAGDSLRTAGALDAAAFSFASADSQLGLAQAEAPRWAEPSIQRAELAYRRMWLHLRPPAVDMAAAGQALRSGVGHADAALAIAPADASALELRGLLNYWRWRLRAGSDTEIEEARRRAEADLNRATALDGSRGRAWSVLSALHHVRGDFPAANFAARRAYRADPYLENAVETVVRLFNTSLEIGDAAGARHWCEEIARLGSQSWMPQHCVLEQMAWYGPPDGVDADSVRKLVEFAVSRPGAAQGRARLEMTGAVILARMQSPDTRSAIATARELGRADDAHLVTLEAWAHVVLGDHAAAAALLARAAAIEPRTAPATLASRRFEALRKDGGLRGLAEGE